MTPPCAVSGCTCCPQEDSANLSTAPRVQNQAHLTHRYAIVSCLKATYPDSMSNKRLENPCTERYPRTSGRAVMCPGLKVPPLETDRYTATLERRQCLTNHTPILRPSKPAPGYLPERNENRHPHKDLCVMLVAAFFFITEN